MTINKVGIVLVLVLVLGIAGVFYLYPQKTVSVQPVACTMDAKVCPDGSSVGRSGPTCAFTECPDAPIVKEEARAALNQKIFNNGIFITPLEVIEDSRCPTDVVCVSAGNVSLKVKLEKEAAIDSIVLKLQSPVVFEGYTVTLTEVTPLNTSKTILDKTEYRFTFNVTALALPATGTISGKVTTSPTCAVEPVPSEPQCSPKPYGTEIRIREAGKSTVVKTISSNNSGVFATDLPEGVYELDAQTVGTALFPRCDKERVTVKSGQTSAQDISCDTGIR